MMLASRYRILDEIGSGGMGRVHLAQVTSATSAGEGDDDEGPAWVAIKRPHEHLLCDDLVVRMFVEEGRIAARIHHPNVAKVVELGTGTGTGTGEGEGEYFIAMEYLHGEPLREIARRTSDAQHPLPARIACRILCDAAEGLHAAHELTGPDGQLLGLVHRDVTPHNLFVTYEGVTKVLDFGAMATSGDGTLIGKPAYMSPEQANGESVDRRADVFALGIVAWELTTGQRLFRGKDDVDTVMRVRECVVPLPSTLVPGFPPELEGILMKALARNPNERYATARQFARALQLMLMARGELVTREDVAAFLRGLVPEHIEERDAELRAYAEHTITSITSITSVHPALAATLTDPTALAHARNAITWPRAGRNSRCRAEVESLTL